MLALGLAGALTSVWLDVRLGNAWPMLQALIAPTLVATAVVVLAGAAYGFARDRIVAVLGGVLALVALPSAWLTLRPLNAGSKAAGSHTLRVMSSNVEYGQADPRSVVSAVSDRDIDVLVLVELTGAELRRLDEAGLRQKLPYRTTGLMDSGATGSMVLSRFPLRTVTAGAPGPGEWFQMPVADVATAGGTVRVKGVHTPPPVPVASNAWHDELAHRVTRGVNFEQGRTILAGDFNASRAHPVFRGLLEGTTDALPATCCPTTPTWPRGSKVPAFTQIDHILARGLHPTRSGVIELAGTDHAAIWSELRY